MQEEYERRDRREKKRKIREKKRARSGWKIRRMKYC